MLRKRGVKSEVVEILAFNYREEDDGLLIAAMKKLGPLKHRVSSELSHLAGRDTGVRLSERMLRHLYETTPCSFCRWRVVAEMGRRRLITREMAEECLHDASDDIRRYAERRIRRAAKA